MPYSSERSRDGEAETITYEGDGRVARITLDRPERGNGITLEMPRELAACVERANLDPEVHVIALAGNGRASAAATTWSDSAEGRWIGTGFGRRRRASRARRSIPAVQAANHDPGGVWDPVSTSR